MLHYPERARVYNLMRVYANSSTPAAWVWCKVYKCGIGHGTPGGTPGIKKVHFSSTPEPRWGVLLVVHPMYSRTPSG